MAHPAQSVNKIIVYALLAFLLTRCNSAGHPVMDVIVKINTDTGLRPLNGVMNFGDGPYTGIVYSLYTGTKDTAEIASYKKGKEHGTWKKFYEGGSLQEQREFTDGMKTGEYVAWWENGKERLRYFFKNDEYEGTCREWNTKGLLVKEMNYKNGHEAGAQRWWYDNGKIKANYVITDGRRYGLLGTKNCINVSDSVFKN